MRGPAICSIVLLVGMQVIVSSFRAELRAAAAMQGEMSKSSNGAELFMRRCGGCHSLDQDKEGPRLRTVYGRKAGSIESFRYSAALASSGIVWDDAALDKWLTDTNAMVPGSEMDFRVPSPEERSAIIGFLKSAAGR